MDFTALIHLPEQTKHTELGLTRELNLSLECRAHGHKTSHTSRANCIKATPDPNLHLTSSGTLCNKQGKSGFYLTISKLKENEQIKDLKLLFFLKTKFIYIFTDSHIAEHLNLLNTIIFLLLFKVMATPDIHRP